MWQDAQPICWNSFSPSRAALRRHGIGAERSATGTGSVAWKSVAGGDIGAGQFVHHAIAVRIGADAEALGGLHAVVLIEGVVW